MNIKKYISLESYFQSTNKYYLFFDSIMKQQHKLQKEVLKEVGIPASTYRVNRMSDVVKNDNYMKLLNYFDIQPLRPEQQKEYENVLTECFSAIYYRNVEELEKNYNTLCRFIEENNYLKPIFVLFRLQTDYILYGAEQVRQDENIKRDLEYLSLFERDFFENEFEILYLGCFLFVVQNKGTIDDEMTWAKYPECSGFYYFQLARYYHHTGRDAEAVLYLEKSQKLFLEDCNIDRYLLATQHMAALYTHIECPNVAYDVLKPLFEYVISKSCEKGLKKEIVSTYLLSLFMMKKFQSVVSTVQQYLDQDDFFPVTAILVMLSYKETGNFEKIESLSSVGSRSEVFYKFYFQRQPLTEEERPYLKGSKVLDLILKQMKIVI